VLGVALRVACDHDQPVLSGRGLKRLRGKPETGELRFGYGRIGRPDIGPR
jgi:hypothetical protein